MNSSSTARRDDVEEQAQTALAESEPSSAAVAVERQQQQPNNKVPQLASVAQVFSFATERRTRWYIALAFCFAIGSGSVFPGKNMAI